ncbi:type VI immunity family protein [Cystobacter ferrugineus]|uniref:type VI immunity family protein n=1 Tax=Cystobacter ferrugineus TaxID=83449 RepID=UPI000A74D8B4|nr:type VI immunity family protein [Cystobacter ferrugineus]
MRYPRIRHFNEHGRLRASDAVILSFYLRHPNERFAPAVVRALELLRERIRPYSFERYVGEGQTEPLDEPSWEKLRQQTLAPGPEEAVFLVLEGKSDDVDELHVDYRGLDIVPLPWPDRKHDVSVLYIRLPTEYLEERGPAHVQTLALELAAELPFNSGYVDFALCTDPWYFSEVLPLIHPRFPGVHLASSSAELSMDTWVEGVHWMNFLGQPVLGQLGGVAALKEALSLPGISLQEMSGDRVLITLSERPEPGDTQAGQTLPLHRALARLLEPHLHHWGFPATRLDAEQILRWERRFLD